MPSVASYAAALLPFADRSDPAGVLFRRAELPYAVAPRTTLPDDLVAATVKGPVQRVITAVTATRNPELLERFAKDPRVTVQRAVAANPALPLDACRRLHAQAHKRGDAGMLRSLVGRIPLDELLDAMERSETLSQDRRFPVDQVLAVHLSGSELDRRDVELLLGCASRRLVISTLTRAYAAGVSGLDIADMVALIRPHFVEEALRSLLRDASRIDAEAMACFLEPTRRRQVWSRADHVRDQVVTSDAVRMLLAAGPGRTELFWLASHQLPADVAAPVVAAVIDAADRGLYVELVSANGETLDGELAEAVVSAALEQGKAGHGLARSVLTFLAAPLSSERFVSLMRHASFDDFSRWMYGNYELHLPRPGEGTALVSDAEAIWGQSTAGDIAYQLSRAVAAIRQRGDTPAWESEFVDACGASYLALVPVTTSAAEHVSERFSAGFGDDELLWQVGLELLADWTGSLAQLIEASYLTLGRELPSAEAAAGDDDVPAVGEQLALI